MMTFADVLERPVTPMRLFRIPEAFDNPDWIFEPKMDGFRPLAHVKGHHCTLVSPNGHAFKSWPQLAEDCPFGAGTLRDP